MKKNLIILTCTVRPTTNVQKTRRFETKLRLIDYQKSIEFWSKYVCKNQEFDLLILENSSSINMLRKYERKSELFTKIIFRECTQDTLSLKQGISAGELSMLRQSNNFVNHQDYNFIWKVTGRSRIANIRQVLGSIKRADIVADRVFIPRHALNSRFFGMSPECWEEFTTRKVNFNETNRSHDEFESMEHYLTAFALEMEFRGYRQRGFLKTPIFLEHSGSTNKRVDSIQRSFLLAVLNPIRPFLIRLLLGSTP